MTLLSVTWSSCSRTHRWQLVEGLQQQSFSSHSGMDHGANRDFPGRLVVKNMPCQCGRCKRCEFDSWVGKIPWSRKWQPTPVFLPRESHGQRNLVGYSPWGRRVGHGWSSLAHMHAWVDEEDLRRSVILLSSTYLKCHSSLLFSEKVLWYIGLVKEAVYFEQNSTFDVFLSLLI